MKWSQVIWNTLGTGAAGYILYSLLTYKPESMNERVATANGAWNNLGNIRKPMGNRGLFQGEMVFNDGSPQSSFSDTTKAARAIARILKTGYNTQNEKTPRQIIEAYDGTASEETKRNYSQSIADAAGIGVNDDIGTDDLTRVKIIDAIVRFEQGREWSQHYDSFIRGWAVAGVAAEKL